VSFGCTAAGFVFLACAETRLSIVVDFYELQLFRYLRRQLFLFRNRIFSQEQSCNCYYNARPKVPSIGPPTVFNVL